MEKTKEVAIVRSELNSAHKAAKALRIKNDTEYIEAGELLLQVKNVGTRISEAKKQQLDPANETVKRIKEFWGPIENQYKEAESTIKSLILTYRQKLIARQQKREATISRQVESGKISFENGVEKIQDISKITIPNEVQVRKIKKIRFVSLHNMTADEIGTLLAGDYIKWDEVKVRRDLLNGRTIPGASIYDEEIIAA